MSRRCQYQLQKIDLEFSNIICGVNRDKEHYLQIVTLQCKKMIVSQYPDMILSQNYRCLLSRIQWYQMIGNSRESMQKRDLQKPKNKQ